MTAQQVLRPDREHVAVTEVLITGSASSFLPHRSNLDLSALLCSDHFRLWQIPQAGTANLYNTQWPTDLGTDTYMHPAWPDGTFMSKALA